MPKTLLKTFELSMNVESFVDKLWINKVFYEKFLTEKLKDVGVEIGDWSDANEANESNCRKRQVRSFHPAKISFPGLPSHAESLKSHILEFDRTSSTIVITEINSFQGIPYSDYFNVITEWEIVSSDKEGCKVSIFLDFKFLKYTWLQGTIESNTKAELVEVFDLWNDSANQYIRFLMDRKITDDEETALGIHNNNNNNTNHIIVEDNSKLLNVNVNGKEYDNDSEEEEENNTMDNKLAIDISGDAEEEFGDNSTDHGTSASDGDELSFYDCEEGDNKSNTSSKSSHRHQHHHNHHNNTASDKDDEFDSEHEYVDKNEWIKKHMVSKHHNNPITPELRRYYRHHQHHQHHATLAEGGDDNNIETAPYTSSHDIAVQCVETVFVMAEFFFWQIYQFYTYDLKELFDIEPQQVISRIINSFLPGWHCPILLKPDVYGPLLGVFLLPQSLLLSVETSRHGCNPTSQLGNAIVVTFLVWIGLSALYRILALVVAPNITYKHCLSVIGYSFYSWNFAIICTLPLERYKHHISVSFLLPLVLFGLPTSISQGYMFWEYTPASTMTFQPSSLPTSVQPFVSYNARCFQRIVWALPKIVAFLLVACTHYQLLWYIARVFLPGSRQLCKLSALVQPSQYADILTQKDIRVFALKLLSGKADEE